MERAVSEEWTRLQSSVGGAAAAVKRLSTYEGDRGIATAGSGCLPGARLPVLAFELDDVRARPRAADDLGRVDFCRGKEYGAGRNILEGRLAVGCRHSELGTGERDGDMVRVGVHALTTHAHPRPALVLQHPHAVVLEHDAVRSRRYCRRILSQYVAGNPQARE